MFFVVYPQLFECQILSVGNNTTNRISCPHSEQPIYHILIHLFCRSTDSYKSPFGSHAKFCFEIWLFYTTGNYNLYHIFAVYFFYRHIEQSHCRWRNIVFYSVFNLQYTVVGIFNTYGVAVFVYTNVYIAPFFVIQECYNFFFYI